MEIINNKMKIYQRIALLFMATILMGCTPEEEAVDTSEHSVGNACAELSNVTLPHAVITEAKRVPAGDYRAMDGKNYTVPAFCKVHVVSVPTEDSHINIEVWMPEKKWNGRYYQLGMGGFSGSIKHASYQLVRSIINGDAAAATDSGHKAMGNDASWALNAPEKTIDYGYRSLKETTDVAKNLIEVFYRKKPNYSYFSGCSGGGRQGMMVAHRYADDWDGILIGAPVNDWIRAGTSFVWNHHALEISQETKIPVEKLPIIQKAALSSCTEQAHVVNDIAGDTRFCPFNPGVLVCQGEDTAYCLTGLQAAALKKVYDGTRHPQTGARIYPGFEPTMEAEGEWAWRIASLKTGMNENYKHGQSLFAHMVFDNPDWDIHSFDYGKDVAVATQKDVLGTSLGKVLNITSPDFKAMQKHGGKVIQYHGWGDAVLMARGSTEDYENAIKGLGGLQKAQEFYRLFMVPGMLHCRMGPGANFFGQHYANDGSNNDATHNIRRALEAWVEKGVAPDNVIATKYNNDKPEQGIAFTRPLCAYPKVRVYKGSGDINKASNFKCVQGASPPQ